MWKYLAVVMFVPPLYGCTHAEAADERSRKDDAGTDAGVTLTSAMHAPNAPAAQAAMIAPNATASSGDTAITGANATSARGSEACPEGMILVEGEYCPDVEQHCLKWMDPPGDRYAHFRC